MFDVVSWPASSSRPGDADELVVGELVAVLADQHAEDVLARLPPRPRDQRGHVLAALPLQFQPLGDRNGQVELARAALLEVLAVVVGHAEQFADHQRRDGQREVLAPDPLAGPRLSIASRCASTISTMRGSSRFIRRMVNSGVSMRRSR